LSVGIGDLERIEMKKTIAYDNKVCIPLNMYSCALRRWNPHELDEEETSDDEEEIVDMDGNIALSQRTLSSSSFTSCKSHLDWPVRVHIKPPF